MLVKTSPCLIRVSIFTLIFTIILLSTMNKRTIRSGVYSLFSFFVILGIAACGSDFLIDPAGECVSCLTSATGASPQVSIEACADGDGNITVTTDGNAATAVTSELSLSDFRISQEGTGSTCN